MKPILLATFALVSGLCVGQAGAGETNSTSASRGTKSELTASNETKATNGAATVSVDKSVPVSIQPTVPAEALTKAPPSKAKSVVALFNPFAPLPPEPRSSWRERTGWGGAADKTSSMTPEAVRHEAQFGMVVANW